MIIPYCILLCQKSYGELFADSGIGKEVAVSINDEAVTIVKILHIGQQALVQ